MTARPDPRYVEGDLDVLAAMRRVVARRRKRPWLLVLHDGGDIHIYLRTRPHQPVHVDLLAWTVAELDRLEAERDAAHKLRRRTQEHANRLEARITELETALRVIAEPDDLLDANEDAFSVPAARRMQAQARQALVGGEVAPPLATTASERVRTLEAAAGAVVDEWGTDDWISSTLEAALNDLRTLLDPDGAVTDD